MLPTVKASPVLSSERLMLRRPSLDDASEIFATYAGDRRIGNYTEWLVHRSVRDTEDFIAFSDSEWERWPAGPYLIHSKFSGELLGSTGLSFTSPVDATTGCVIARSCWGNGFGTEAVLAIRNLANKLGVTRLEAYCHPYHKPSRRVLEKAGFDLQEHRRRCRFPNLDADVRVDAVCYAYFPATQNSRESRL